LKGGVPDGANPTYNPTCKKCPPNGNQSGSCNTGLVLYKSADNVSVGLGMYTNYLGYQNLCGPYATVIDQNQQDVANLFGATDGAAANCLECPVGCSDCQTIKHPGNGFISVCT
jgi:hypothetical protein